MWNKALVVSTLFGLACAGPRSTSLPADDDPSSGAASAASETSDGERRHRRVFLPDDEAAVVRAFARATSESLGTPCVSWPASFPRVVVVGSFAHDAGCLSAGIFVDRRLHRHKGERRGLDTRDFRKVSAARKQVLARAWIDEVEHAFGGDFETKHSKAFELEGSPPYEPVRVRIDGQGGVVVEGWVQEPPGMMDQSSFHFVVHRFSADGVLVSRSRNSFSVAGEELRAAEEKAALQPETEPDTGG
ncbi:MAG: hypothetical protein IAG13_22445 [Deltaproteobacteria bacterium]|nr:hypothetical protein [Nannocystaceae bacterium]